MRRLLVLGAAPCMERDIEGIDLSAYDVAAVNRAGLRFPGVMSWWATYHPTDMLTENWTGERKAKGWPMDFSIVLHHGNRRVDRLGFPVVQFAGPHPTGSSALLAVLFGLRHERYDAVLVAGVPLDGPYEVFRTGWIVAKHALAGRVFGLSGWTKQFLEGL